jgi:cytochrome oxidase Cu insertion factor (SCO1/SenC/PrrC family)
MRRGLPFEGSINSPTALGPLLTVGVRLNCGGKSWALATSAATQMTASPALRYNFDLNGEISMQVNDKAPEFTLPDENGKNVSLKDFHGKPVVLFFFPKADTPG